MNKSNNLSESVIFPKGEKTPEAFAKYFIGTSYLKMLVPFDSPLKCPIGNVTFEPGCRNNWHKHPGGQILLVTGGKGWYQEEGKQALKLHAGDVVEIPPNVKHWHGAAADSRFVHIAVEADVSAGPAEWLEPVTDEEYNKLKYEAGNMDKKLGFGCMRLPLIDKNDQTSFDTEKINKLVDTFLEKGFTYFDTAYTYHSYMGENAIKEALVKRHNRDEFTFATKLPMRDINSQEDQEQVFNEQLEKCGVDYFDYYLLHNIGVNAYKKACELDSFGFGINKKKEGKIRNFGMSFHDTPELLDEILTAHPELDFVQLQINYIDWENTGIQSRKCYETARKHNKPIIVMEPCKGGTLALVPDKAEKLMKEYNPKASIPSWAIRFAASQEGVVMVLSGMNTMDHVLDNTSYMSDFKPLTEEEYKVINQVTGIINENTAIHCTICRYCEKGCPKRIAIPDYFALYNSTKRATSENFSSQFVYYINLTANHGKASDCIGCKQCEKICPQHLKITAHLKDVSAAFDVAPQFPTRKK